jgi:hypothetical protein
MAYALARVAKWAGLAAVVFAFNATLFDSISGSANMEENDFRNMMLVVLGTCVFPLGGLGAQLLARRTLKRASVATNN